MKPQRTFTRVILTTVVGIAAAGGIGLGMMAVYNALTFESRMEERQEAAEKRSTDSWKKINRLKESIGKQSESESRAKKIEWDAERKRLRAAGFTNEELDALERLDDAK